MASNKYIPSYSDVVQTIMMGLLGWLALNTHNNSVIQEGVIVRVDQNILCIEELKSKNIKNDDKINDIDKRVFRLEAIKEDDDDYNPIKE